MKYFRGCLNESLRILPTIPYMGCLLPEETSLRGYHIPANTFVMWSAILLGKDPILFPDPEKFLPESKTVLFLWGCVKNALQVEALDVKVQ